MNKACLAINNKSFINLPTNRGVSEDAKNLQAIYSLIIEDIFQSIALGEPHRKALTALWDVYQECLNDNWDGYGAKAISPINYIEALRFLKTLPTSIPIPEVSVDPDGEIVFEWYKGPRNVFSVSISPNNELTYAGIFGGSKTHGVEYFGDDLPKTILENLYRLFAQGI